MSRITSEFGTGVELCVSWVPSSGGQIPQRAVKAGGSCYVARALHNGENVPGKVVEGHNCCYIPYGGKEHSKYDYEVLVETDTLGHCGTEWRNNGCRYIPEGAIAAGSDNRRPSYIARGRHSGEFSVGKFVPQLGCYIPYGGNEHQIEDFEVLCCVSRNI